MSSTSANREGECPLSKRFYCSQCQKGYTKLEHLQRHDRTHSNSKPFRCHQCGRCFGRQDVLGRHLRLHTATTSTLHSESSRARGSGHEPIVSLHPTIPDDNVPLAANVEQTDLSNPPFEPDNLLEWLMSDMHGTSFPLPLIDLPLSATYNLNLSAPEQDLSTNQGPGTMALRQIYKLIDDLSKRLNSDVNRTGFTSAFLEACLHECFERVIPGFSVVHKTFSPQSAIPPLLLNMVALGSLFVCEPGAFEKGEMLWGLGHTAAATSWQALIGIRGPWDSCDGVQLVLTALLGQTYALLSRNSSIRTTASVFHGLGFYWARTSGMYTIRDVLSEGIPTVDMPDSQKQALWRKWAAMEVQCRAILGHYVLDGLISQASGSPASARHLINSLGPACSDAAFSAKTADDWIIEMTRSATMHGPVSMSESFTRIFSSEYLREPLPLSRFSIFALLEGLQSLASDNHEARGLVFGAVSRKQIIQALLNLYKGNILPLSSSPTDHSQLLIRWHSIFIEVTAPTASIYGRLRNQHAVLDALGGIHAKDWDQTFDPANWAYSKDAIRSVLHAVSITKLLNDAPLGAAHAVHIPTSIFTSAVVMASMCLLNKHVLLIPETYNWWEIWSESWRADALVEGVGTVSVNLFNEINSLQISLETIASRWRVSEQMADIIRRLATLSRERHTPQVAGQHDSHIWTPSIIIMARAFSKFLYSNIKALKLSNE